MVVLGVLVDLQVQLGLGLAGGGGFEAGLDVLGYTDQANLLFNCGVLDCLARRAPEESTDYIRAAKALQRLTGPHEMGELFKVIALGRGISQPLIGFLRGDRLHAL